MSSIKEFESKSLKSSRLNKSSKRIINIDRFLDELKCSICLDFFHNPRTLNCQHSFCSGCLEPLTKDKIFSCPQCRQSNYYESIDKVPKNSLLSNLVNNIKLTKAACPECKELNELNVCEHCSQLFCENCLQKHMQKTLEKLDNRLVTIETLPKIIQNLKSNINKSEQDTLLKMVNHMDKLQAQILSLWQTRKYTLVDEIRKFYKLKTEQIEIAEFRLHVLTKTIASLNKRKNDLEKNFSTNSDSKYFSDLTQLEIDLVDLEAKFQEAFANFDINSNELKLKYNELNNVEVFRTILDNVKLVSCSSKDDKILDNVVQPGNSRNEIIVKDYFGNTACLELNSDSRETIENLKTKIKFLLGVEPKCINLIDKRKNQHLDDKLELVCVKGKIYAKKINETASLESGSEDDECKYLPNDEIELFISYKHSN